ncbi:MAG: hypothetical protein QOI58_1668 [Thermoanaerobaculia bacterium]|jgi:methyl-accepting chemotaxis protein|nr:hypothetical protein [Thermoanaerobaculia bacterium]
MSLAAVASLAARLLRSYAFDAWPFGVLHVVVVAYLVRSILRLHEETDALSTWDPTAADATGAAAVLSRFIRDSANLGERGFIVPITDYSDRLDAEVENLISEVADRTNMLLLVGIAGTLFGVFEFASRTMHVRGDVLAQIGRILAESMAKAFPVGFVGLMLMLVFQLALGGPVARLHRAASEATTRALEHRGVVSRTLAETIASSIAESMRPVSTLGETVSEHLQPVVSALGERLDQSLSLVRLQFGEIDRSTQRFIEATGHLRESANAMTNTSRRLEELLKSTPKVLANTERVQQLHKELLDQLGKSFVEHVENANGIADVLQRVRTSAEGLPEELIQQLVAGMRPMFERLATDAAATWETLSQELGGELRQAHQEFVHQTGEDIAGVYKAVRGAADEWQRLGQDGRTLISDPLQRSLDTIETASAQALGTAADIARSVAAAGADLEHLPAAFAERTASSIEPVFAKLAEESLGEWRRLATVVHGDMQRELSEFVYQSRQEVERTNEALREAADELRRVTEGAQASLTEPIATAIETARREVSAVVEEVADFVRDRYPAIRADMEKLGIEVSSIVQALRTAEQELQRTPVVAASASPEERSSEELQLLGSILEVLRGRNEAPKQITLWSWLFFWRHR